MTAEPFGTPEEIDDLLDRVEAEEKHWDEARKWLSRAEEAAESFHESPHSTDLEAASAAIRIADVHVALARRLGESK